MIERHDGHVGRLQERNQTNTRVLQCSFRNSLKGKRFANERKGQRERQALGTAGDGDPLAHAHVERRSRLVVERHGIGHGLFLGDLRGVHHAGQALRHIGSLLGNDARNHLANVLRDGSLGIAGNNQIALGNRRVRRCGDQLDASGLSGAYHNGNARAADSRSRRPNHVGRSSDNDGRVVGRAYACRLVAQVTESKTHRGQFAGEGFAHVGDKIGRGRIVDVNAHRKRGFTRSLEIGCLVEQRSDING